VPIERFFAAFAEPTTRVRAVESGIRMTSSWSVPIRLWPWFSSSPITVKGTRLMRMVWSTGSAEPKSCFATVEPIRQTLAAETPRPARTRGPRRAPTGARRGYSAVMP
jgi:hypothetical protein